MLVITSCNDKEIAPYNRTHAYLQNYGIQSTAWGSPFTSIILTYLFYSNKTHFDQNQLFDMFKEYNKSNQSLPTPLPNCYIPANQFEPCLPPRLDLSFVFIYPHAKESLSSNDYQEDEYVPEWLQEENKLFQDFVQHFNSKLKSCNFPQFALHSAKEDLYDNFRHMFSFLLQEANNFSMFAIYQPMEEHFDGFSYYFQQNLKDAETIAEIFIKSAIHLRSECPKEDIGKKADFSEYDPTNFNKALKCYREK